MYLFLVVVVAVPLVWISFDPYVKVGSEVKATFKTVEKIQTDEPKIAIISVVWGAGTIAENRTQMEVVVRHLFSRGVPVAILPWDLQGTPLSEGLVDRIAKEMGKEYGKDYLSFGYRPAYMDVIAQGMATDLVGTLKTDKYGTPLTDYKKLPMMRGVRNAQQIGLLMETTPSGTLPVWISYLCGPYKVPLIYGPTAVMVPEGYNYMDSKQIQGMLPGLMGATQYAELLKKHGIVKEGGFATRAANALSTSHVLIIILIILGNLGYFMSRRQQNVA
jgi:hypothetical protein